VRRRRSLEGALTVLAALTAARPFELAFLCRPPSRVSVAALSQTRRAVKAFPVKALLSLNFDFEFRFYPRGRVSVRVTES
jgi:hypothetical protein